MKYKIELPGNYMKPALPGRDVWCAALRSGRYRQGSTFLKSGDCYCCLGVLCEIQNRPSGKAYPYLDSGVYEFDGSSKILREENPLHAILTGSGFFPNGIEVLIARGKSGVSCASLARCNDAGLSFDDIANIIEVVWENI